MKPVAKPANFKFLCLVNVEEITLFYRSLSSKVWEIENAAKENQFACFHHTQHIIFRFIKSFKDHRVFYSNPIWEIAKPILEPVFAQVSAQYGYQNPVYPKAMLAKLQAGQMIDGHTDGAGSNLYTHKIHIPLVTHPDVLMCIDGHTEHLEVGKVYEVNNLVMHSVQNDSYLDRVHLIFEVFNEQ